MAWGAIPRILALASGLGVLSVGLRHFWASGVHPVAHAAFSLLLLGAGLAAVGYWTKRLPKWRRLLAGLAFLCSVYLAMWGALAVIGAAVGRGEVPRRYIQVVE